MYLTHFSHKQVGNKKFVDFTQPIDSTVHGVKTG